MAANFPHQFIAGTRDITVLVLHPAEDELRELVPICRIVAQGAGVLSPRLAPGTGAADISRWIDAAAAEHGFDGRRVYVFAYGDGAALAASILLLYPRTLAGGILMRPDAVVIPAPLPELGGVRVLIAAGNTDVDSSRQLARLLAETGAAVDFAVMDSGRDLIPQDFAMAKKWFAQLP